MTSAAKELRITQPALSHAITKLESELGVPLFERKGRNVHLNRYGQMFSSRVEEALRSIGNGVREIEESSNAESGVVHISYLNILGVDLIPSLIRDYQTDHPQVRFELYQGNHTLGLALDGLVWIPIEEQGWEWEVGLQWHTNRYLSPASRRLYFLQ